MLKISLSLEERRCIEDGSGNGSLNDSRTKLFNIEGFTRQVSGRGAHPLIIVSPHFHLSQP